MKPFSTDMTRLETILSLSPEPDKRNILAVLRHEMPARTPLFDLFLNDGLYARVTADLHYDESDPYVRQKRIIDAYCRLGYDHVNLYGAKIRFPVKVSERRGATASMNDHAIITSRETFEAYPWPDPEKADYGRMDVIGEYLPPGMGYIVYGPGGVEETLIELVGYENLCYLLSDDPELVEEIVSKIGNCLYKYYDICAGNPHVDALLYNDDWGFNTQTLLAPATLRALIFPWVKKITSMIHAHGKPVILHSCGNLSQVMEDIIRDLHFDAKHSYQDCICPVETFYGMYKDRIAVLGGMDVDYVIRARPEDVYHRACGLLCSARAGGNYALGTGNSVPAYVPDEQFMAMIAAALYNR